MRTVGLGDDQLYILYICDDERTNLGCWEDSNENSFINLIYSSQASTLARSSKNVLLWRTVAVAWSIVSAKPTVVMSADVPGEASECCNQKVKAYAKNRWKLGDIFMDVVRSPDG